MTDKAFLDSDILIYAMAKDNPRGARAEELLAAGGVVSVQVLNEFATVARSKLGMSWEEITEVLDAIRILCPFPVPITLEMHELALKIAQQHGWSVYDALPMATALETKSSTLYSERIQAREAVEGKLVIRNPFA